ncbi:MAG: prepilin-type N-terminal cleavage/methylation domain-containing protein [Candidatus Eremiobacteraeota bacterium]|nr:prepilin-type N-terminal cleavage/methylation domain-containing protein [Candidatus Eremiobacteraeota bacterium]
MKRRNLPQGFTLAEILIAASIMLVVLGLLFAMLVPTARGTTRGTLRVEMQQAALRVMNTLERDLALSAASGLTVSTNGTVGYPVLVGMIPIKTVLEDGTQQWEDKLIVYSWKSPESPVVRKVWQSPGPPSISAQLSLNSVKPLRADEATLGTIAEDPSLAGRVLAGDVTEFKVTQGGTATAVVPPLTVTIKMEKKGNTGSTEPERYELTETMTVRNQ